MVQRYQVRHALLLLPLYYPCHWMMSWRRVEAHSGEEPVHDPPGKSVKVVKF